MDKAPDVLFFGDSVFSFDQARALISKGLNVAVFNVDVSAHAILEPFSLGISQGVEDGVSWYKIAVPVWGRKMPVFTELYDKFRSKVIMWAFKKLYARAFGKDAPKPLLLHAHFERSYTSVLLARAMNVPLVITEHRGGLLMEEKFQVTVEHAKHLCLSAAKVIAVSSPIAEKIHEYCGVRCEVIPNIIEVRTFTHGGGGMMVLVSSTLAA